jgi:hypothetical protein
MDCRLGLQDRRVAPNEELKLSACGGNGRTPGDGLEELAGCAGTGRSLTPVRYVPYELTRKVPAVNEFFEPAECRMSRSPYPWR